MKIKTEECWIWDGIIINSGYGKTTKHTLAHREIWELVNGKISENIFVLHRCDNKLCINPNHLFLGTHKDNMRDMCFKKRDKNGKKSHCINGHEFNNKNTSITKDGRRQCKPCHLAYQRKWYAKKINNEK